MRNKYQMKMKKIGLSLIIIMCMASCTTIREGISYNAVMKKIRSIHPDFYSRKKLLYGDDKRQFCMVYSPEVVTQEEVIFYIHGGGWKSGDQKEFEFLAKFFTQHGYVVVLPSYRLAPQYQFDQIQDDVFSGFIKTDKYLGQKKYILSGSSAGAHLASLLLLHSEVQKKYGVEKESFVSFISFAGVLDFEQCQSSILRSMISKMVGEPWSGDHRANPITHLRQGEAIPIYGFHSSSDGIADYENALSFFNRADELGYPTELITIDGLTHDQSYTQMFLMETTEQALLLELLNK